MMRKIASAIATLSLLFYSLAVPTFAQTMTLEVTGNGADSTSAVDVTNETQTTVVQENTAKIENNIDAQANTGGNEAKDNTNGDVSIDTGNATTTVDVANQANANVANVDCQTCTGDVDALISGNGAVLKRYLIGLA